MNQITLLVDLQQIDTKSDENAAVRVALESKLADSSALLSARATLETTDKQSSELKSKLRALELETAGIAEKLKTVSERLYSGRISNAKELSGLSADEKMLQRRKSELEDRELALMEQIETAENLVKEKRVGFEKINTATASRNDKERAALAELDAADADLNLRRARLREKLPQETLYIYDDLRLTKKGRAVVAMKADSCSACGSAVPSGLVSRVKSGSELVFCTNCRRILAP